MCRCCYAHLGADWRAAAYARQREFEKALVDVEKWIELEPGKKGKDYYIKTLRRETRKGAFDGFFRAETDHYVLITDVSQAAANEMAEHAELIFKLYTSRLPRLDKGAEKFPIIFFKSQRDYYDYGAPSNTYGFYSTYARKLVLFDTGK